MRATPWPPAHGVRLGLRWKLIIAVLLSVGLIGTVAFAYTYSYMRNLIVEDAARDAETLADGVIARIERELQAVEQMPEHIATLLQQHDVDDDTLRENLQVTVRRNTAIAGAAVAFEPYARHADTRYFAPYYFQTSNGLGYSELQDPRYNYFHRDWYLIPRELARAEWSEPYFNGGGDAQLMATYSVPVFQLQDHAYAPQGIVRADVSLEWLSSILEGLSILDNGYAFLLSRNGTYVTHPVRDRVMNERLFTLGIERESTPMQELAQQMTRGHRGLFEIDCEHQEGRCQVFHAPLSGTGWSLAVVMPRDEILAGIVDLHRNVLAIGLIGAGMLLLVVVLVANHITGPLRHLSAAVQQAGQGKLDTPIPEPRSADEIADLARHIKDMQQDLRQHISDLKATTAAKQRIESELNVAREIQMGILPKIFPPFPDKPEFDIYATIEPAKEVGGDFYDFFQVDDHRVFLVIGDVSDKGVPASLFMAVTKTLVKATAGQDPDPASVLRRVNDELAQDNESAMFVTLFCALLDLRDGELQFASGGHNAPLVIDKNGGLTALELRGGAVIGALEGAPVVTGRHRLGPDDRLYLYTDGVTEAHDEHQSMFGEARLSSVLRREHRLPLRELITRVGAEITTFVGEAPQSDDITMMAVELRAGHRTESV